MENPEPLDNVVHKNLCIDLEVEGVMVSNTNIAPIMLWEFADIQKEYPIFFRSNPKSNEFQAVALLGLDKDENLFWNNGWITRHAPALLARGPFLLGPGTRSSVGEEAEPALYIDIDDPRVSFQAGEPVFLAHGGHTPYLERAIKILKKAHSGQSVSSEFFQALSDLDLFEKVEIKVELNESQTYTIPQFYSISYDRLDELNPEQVYKLHKSGFLEAIYLVLSSHNNVHRLTELKQRRSAE